MRQYRIDNKDRKAYPLGLIHVDGGIHVSVTAEAKSCNFVWHIAGGGTGSYSVSRGGKGRERMGDDIVRKRSGTF